MSIGNDISKREGVCYLGIREREGNGKILHFSVIEPNCRCNAMVGVSNQGYH